METVLFDQSFFSASESYYWIRCKTVLEERASGQPIFWIVETIVFSIFQRLLPVIVFIRLVETMFQENPSFRPVETDFGANNGFRKKKEKL